MTDDREAQAAALAEALRNADANAGGNRRLAPAYFAEMAQGILDYLALRCIRQHTAAIPGPALDEAVREFLGTGTTTTFGRRGRVIWYFNDEDVSALRAALGAAPEAGSREPDKEDVQ